MKSKIPNLPPGTEGMVFTGHKNMCPYQVINILKMCLYVPVSACMPVCLNILGGSLLNCRPCSSDSQNLM